MAGVVLASVSLGGASSLLASGCSSFSSSEPAADAASEGAVDPDASVDAAADAITPTDSGPAFCSTIDAEFCADFETLPVSRNWDSPLNFEGALKEQAPGAEGSAFALRATTPPAVGAPPAGQVLPDPLVDGGTFAFQSALVFHDFLLPNSTVEYEGDLRIEELPPYPAKSQISAFAFNGASGTTGVAVLFREHGGTGGIDVVLSVNEGKGILRESVEILPKGLGEWFHVRLVLDRTGNGQARLAIDGVAVATVSPTSVFQGLTKLRISAGIVRRRSPTTDTLLYDNVVLRTE